MYLQVFGAERRWVHTTKIVADSCLGPDDADVHNVEYPRTTGTHSRVHVVYDNKVRMTRE